MPQAQVIDLGRDESKEKGVMGFLNELGNRYKEGKDKQTFENLLGEYQKNINDENAYEQLQINLMKSDIAPTKRLELQQQLNQMQEGIIKNRNSFTAKAKKLQKTGEDRDKLKANLIASGYPEHVAEQYLDATPAVQATLQRENTELVARGLRKIPEAPQSKNANETELGANPSESVALQEVKENPDSWPELPSPEKMNYAEKVKWGNDNQKTNNKELQKTQIKKHAYETNKNLIKGMTQLNESKKLPSGLSSIIVDPSTGTIRPEASLVGAANKETQKYAKNLAQFIKGAKEIFGSRVTNFDVSTFMNQLPTLLNSEEGRRVILKEMELVNELETLYNNTMDEALKKYSRDNYADIVNVVEEKVQGKASELIQKIDNVVEASNFLDVMSKNPTKFKDTVLMQSPEGKFKAVKKDQVDKAPEGWSVY